MITQFAHSLRQIVTSLQFAYPLWLLAALPLLAHVFWMARRLRMLAPARRGVAVALRVLVLLALVAALAGARIAHLARDLTVIFAVDNSDSIPELQKKHELLYVQHALDAMDRQHDRGGIVLFGASAALEQPPAAQPEFVKPTVVVNTSRTNIADAIQLALACLPEQTQKRIVLLSDGNANAGDAEAAAHTAAAARVPIDVLPLAYENRNDVILEKAIVEERVSLDEPFQLRIVATSREKTHARLNITQDGQLIGQHEIDLLPDRKNVFDYSTEVRAGGRHEFEVQIDAPGDAVPENNRAYAYTYGLGEPTVLLVDGDANPSLVLPAMLRSEKINVERVAPGEMPGSLTKLQTYDSVIFNNVAASDVTGDQMKMIERAVHDLGVGFIMIGGEHSFGAGGYNDSPIERILPVNMELKNERIMPQGALVTIVHTVEIPEGQYWCMQIVNAALDVLSPRDMMGVLYYSWNQQETWLFPLQEVGAKTALHALIQGIQPGDMPSFDRTLQMAYDSLVACHASVKHIVIISDGDPQTPNQGLVQKIKDAKITISTVCINPHNQRDIDVMKSVADDGSGNFYYVQDFHSLPQIFNKEAQTVRKSLIYEEPFTPVVKQYSPLLAGLGAYPQLKGYVGSSAKSLADVPLATNHDDPLLAHWHHGLGKTVAFTSDAKERWAAEWTHWDQYAKFWAQTVRWTLRSAANPNYQMQMSVDGTKGKITVDAVDTAGNFKNFLKIGGQVIGPEMSTQGVQLRQTSPGRYEGEFDVGKPGVYMLGAEAASASGASTDLITGGTTLSYSPEFQNSGSNTALLGRLADLTGGRTLSDQSPVFVRAQTAYAQPTPLWPWLLTAVLILFLADVFTRRVLLGWSDVAGWSATGWRWTAAHLRPRRAAADEATVQLLKAKQAVHEAQIAPQEAEAARREAFLASLRQVDMASSPLREPEPEAARPKITPPQEEPAGAKPDAADADRFTAQLLQARRRRRTSNPDPPKPDEGEPKP